MKQPSFVSSQSHWDVRVVQDVREAIKYGEQLAREAERHAKETDCELLIVRAIDDMALEPNAVQLSFIENLINSDIPAVSSATTVAARLRNEEYRAHTNIKRAA